MKNKYKYRGETSMDKQYRILSNQLIWAENSTDLCKYIKQFFLKEDLTGFP